MVGPRNNISYPNFIRDLQQTAAIKVCWLVLFVFSTHLPSVSDNSYLWVPSHNMDISAYSWTCVFGTLGKRQSRGFKKTMTSIDPAWIALIGTLCGGIGLKIIEHWLGKSKVKMDEAAKLRDELRIQMSEQREEIKQLESEVDLWRKQYYDLRDNYAELNSQYIIIKQQLIALGKELPNTGPENTLGV